MRPPQQGQTPQSQQVYGGPRQIERGYGPKSGLGALMRPQGQGFAWGGQQGQGVIRVDKSLYTGS